MFSGFTTSIHSLWSVQQSYFRINLISTMNRKIENRTTPWQLSFA